MNKYVAFALIALVSLGLDYWSKRVAEAELASSSRRWEHSIERSVTPALAPNGTISIEDFISASLGADALSSDPPLAYGFYRVTEGGSPVRLLNGEMLSVGDTVQIMHREVVVIQGFWSHVYVQNFGAAWGFLSNHDERFVRPFFLTIALIAIVMVLWIFRHVEHRQWRLFYAFPLVAGGAMGNLVDRYRYGYVVDFIDWYVTIGGEEKHWPTFNLADVWLSVGVVLLLLDAIFGHPAAEKDKAAKE